MKKEGNCMIVIANILPLDTVACYKRHADLLTVGGGWTERMQPQYQEISNVSFPGTG